LKATDYKRIAYNIKVNYIFAMGVLLSKEEKIVPRVKEREVLIIKPLALLKREAATRLNFIEEEAQEEELEGQAGAEEQPWANLKASKGPVSLSVVSSES